MPMQDWGYTPSTGYGLPQHPPGQGPDDSPITPYNFGDQRPVTYVPTNYPVGSVPTPGTVVGPPSQLPTFTPDYIANHPNTNKPTTTTKPTGSISFSFGGGGGGGASVPSNVLNTRTFPPYESTWTPPAAVMPEPYNWATRDPYIYGEGLSNAGAAYDIWGSAPGTNPYVMTVPSSYTQGLLGMPPVQLPSNVPSTNVSANLNTNTDTTTKTKPFDPFNETMGVQQSVYEAAMDKRYADTVIDQLGNRGYTGQGNQSRAGINAPGYVNNTVVKVAPPYKPPAVTEQVKIKSAIMKAAEVKYGKNPGGTSKNYGVTGRRIVGGR